MAVVAFKDDDFVAGGASLKAVWVAAAGAFDEDWRGFADEPLVFLDADFGDFLQQLGVPALVDFLRNLFFHIGGRRILSGRVFKDEGVVELGFFG